MSINEEGYSNYLSGLFLASAWWGLRGNSLFPDGNQGVSGVDNLLIAGLGIVKTGIVEGTNNAYRYKPRYFYNILMSSVGGGLTPFSLNPKQIAINKAYESRGFHFTPQVESFSEGNRSRNVFSPGDQVHVKITKAPQNTAFTVYVIRHDDYTYVDGANTSTLTSCLADDFAPITGNSTDASGDWNSLVWTLPTEAGNVDGGYDIIVDFGSPQAPDNQIHYTYTAANVMDGIDGLTEPGFKVRPANNIDLVLALDCSPSMNNRSQLAKTAKQFIAQMLDGDRVGVFGFASDNSGPVIIPRFINNLCHVENTVRVNYAIDPPSAVVIELSEPILARNCHFVNDPGGEQYQNMVLEDCSIGDPLINMGVNGEYTIIWDETAKSPLINTGCPEIDGVPQHDPDGTPPDIGAVYYPYHSRKYFSDVSPSNIYWLSFPVVDDRTNTNGSDYWNELGQMFSEHMQWPSFNLNNISWSYDTDAATMHYQNSIWLEEDHPVTQPKGYKVKFNEGISDCSVVVDGFKADPSTTPVTWAAVDAQNHPFENWVGYFATFTQGAGDALSRYLPGSTRFRYIDYVHTIKTQSWGTCRISEEYNSTWVIDPNTYTVSEGDMLVLVLLPDAPEELYWQFPSASKPPVGKPLSTAFEYTEKLDYTSVFLEFDPQNMPAEVGLYVNGVCKGAAVVDSTLIDVCLYQDDAKDDGELEIVFYHEGKGKKAAKGWKTYNPERMVFEDTGLRTDQIGRYAYLSFNNKEGDSPVPLVTSLSQNYPNPFNPETNISFILANDMHARLDIYNIRGQKIATLFNGDMTKGKHTLQWNGTDAQGRKVASGIYFSRLTTPEGSFSQKMMLMK
ncbi:MAG: T9SS type A sorting domain-containing protein [Candidatus Cloacimonetes bacterium]|nr:T9SS type A sorting domain-containing protein [Candidatus Cloacimonadota bacterium]